MQMWRTSTASCWCFFLVRVSSFNFWPPGYQRFQTWPRLSYSFFGFPAVYIQIIYNQTPGQWELSKDIQTWVSLETQSRETELNNNEVSAKYTLEEGTVESDPNLPLYCQAGTWSVESKVTCEPKIVEKIFCGSVSNVFLLKFGLCVLWVEELCEK